MNILGMLFVISVSFRFAFAFSRTAPKRHLIYRDKRGQRKGWGRFLGCFLLLQCVLSFFYYFFFWFAKYRSVSIRYNVVTPAVDARQAALRPRWTNKGFQPISKPIFLMLTKQNKKVCNAHARTMSIVLCVCVCVFHFANFRVILAAKPLSSRAAENACLREPCGV